jgi:hypothetical protein
MSYDEFDLNKARDVREKTTNAYRRHMRLDFLRTALGSIPVVVLICYGALGWARAEDAEGVRFYGVLYLLGVILLLAVWGLHALTIRIMLLSKDLRLVRLDILASKETPPAAATGGAESLNPWRAHGMQPWVAALIFATVFVVVPLATSFAYSSLRPQYPYAFEDFGGEEVANAHITADDRLRVVSRTVLTRHPPTVLALPIRVSRPGATLESVTLDGRDLPFESDPETPDLYSALTGVPALALDHAMLEVVWSLPLEEAALNGAFNLPLQGTLPVRHYALNAVVDAGAPYIIGPFWGTTWTKSGTLFWSERPGYDAGAFGTAGAGLRRTP